MSALGIYVQSARSRVIERVGLLVPETEAIYETELLGDAASIADQERNVLMIRNRHALREMSHLRDTADTLTERARTGRGSASRPADRGLQLQLPRAVPEAGV